MSNLNQNKAGYKRTPLGWIPEGWEFDYLDNLAKRGSGHTPDKSYGNYYNGGVKWISLADSYRLDNGYIAETEINLSMDGIKNSSAVIHPAETVVLSRDAGVGKSGIMKSAMAVSQHFIAWTCYASLDNWFLYYWLQLKKEFFERHAVGSTIKTIGLGLFKKLKVINPPLYEQRKIATILFTCDEAITKTDQLIKTLQRRNRSLMQKLFSGKKKLRGFDGRYKEISIGDILSESRIPSLDNKPNKRITVRLNQKGIEHRNVRGNEASDGTYYFIRKKGQFIYGKQNLHKGAFGLIPDFLDGFESSQDIPAFDFKNGINPKYFFYFLCQETFYSSLEKYATGTGSKRIQPASLFKVRVKIPDLTEQESIASVLENASKEVELYEQKLAALRLQKKGLMQKLLTGEMRGKI